MKRIAVICTGLAMVAWGCGLPLSDLDLQTAKDGIAPSISVAEPSDGSPYSATVVVVGNASDDALEPGDGAGQVAAISYEVLGTSLAGTATPGTDGEFTFEFETGSLDGSQTLQITALDWNNNDSTITLELTDAGNQIPSFSVVPSNRQVTLQFGEVPLATSYTVYYTDDGSLPSPDYGTAVADVSPGDTITGLENGSAHVFVLRAFSERGDDNFSAPVEAIPLSTVTLAPVVTSEYEAISLIWPAIPGANGYQVLRSTSRGGPYTNISGSMSGTSFRDALVNLGQVYYYKVQPAGANSVQSEPVGAFASALVPFDDRVLGFAPTPDLAFDVVVGGDFAFIADLDNDLAVVNIGNPQNPYLVTELDSSFSGRSTSIARSGTTVYLGHESGGVIPVDVSNPSAPAYKTLSVAEPNSDRFHLPSGQDTGQSASAFTVNNGYVYVAFSDWGVRIFTEDGDAVASYSGAVIDANFSPGSIAVDGSDLFVASGGIDRALYVFDIPTADLSSSDEDTLPAPDRITAIAGAGPDNDDIGFYSMAISGNVMFASDKEDDGTTNAIMAIDITNPVSPALLSRLTYTDGSTRRFTELEVRDDYLYASRFNGEFHIFDVSDTAQMFEVASYLTASSSYGLDVEGGYAYVSDKDYGVQIFDISAAPSFTQLDSISGKNIQDLHRDGDLVLAANGDAAAAYLSIYQESAGTLAHLGDSMDDGSSDVGEADLVNSVGKYALVLQPFGDLLIYDISDPAAPERISTYALPGGGSDLVRFGEYLYVAESGTGFQVINIADPAAPESVRSIIEGSGRGVVLDYPRLYLLGASTTGGGGIAAYDISSPANPVRRGEGTGPGRHGESYSDYLVSIVDEIDLLSTWDISDPWNPSFEWLESSEPAADEVTFTTVAGGYALVGMDGYRTVDPLPGMLVFSLVDPAAPFVVRRYTTHTFVPAAVISGGQMVLAGGERKSTGSADLVLYQMNQ